MPKDRARPGKRPHRARRESDPEADAPSAPPEPERLKNRTGPLPERVKNRTGPLPGAERAKNRTGPLDVPGEPVELKPLSGPVRESKVIEVKPKESREILFGKIAVDCGYVLQKELDRCIQLQKAIEDEQALFLGDILLDQQLLTRAQVEEILRLQHKNLQKQHKYTGHKREEALFGRVVLENKLASESQVNECLRWQAEMERFNEKIPLGELLLAKGYLQPRAVEDILSFQKKGQFRCYRCKEVFTLSLFEFGRKIRCPHCQKVIELPETPESSELKMKAQTQRLSESGSQEARARPAPEPRAEPPAEEAEDAPAQEESSSAEPATRELEAPQPPPDRAGEAAPPGDAQVVLKGWFFGMLGRVYGPIPLRLIKKLLKVGLFGHDDLFWHRESGGWRTARQLDALAPYLPPPPAAGLDGPPKPCQVSSPKSLAEQLDLLLGENHLVPEDHRLLRKMIATPLQR